MVESGTASRGSFRLQLRNGGDMDAMSAHSWAIEPHTEAKHAILSAYLRAWFPILSLGGFPRVIYIDGFAGPGRYEGGQDGSPILALKALAAQRLKLNSDFEFHFVELDFNRATTLKANIEALRSEGRLPARSEIHIHEGKSFEEAYESAIRSRLARISAPAFALVDPFGWTGIPMRIVGELISRPATEVLVNFMFEEINRFLAHPDQPQNFDTLFGGGDWRSACALTGGPRKRFVHDCYRDQLHAVGGARFVRSFEMRNARGLVDYFLFFATKSSKGLAKMKEAMWRVDPEGGLSFSDATNPNQTTLFAKEPDRVLLRRLIADRFKAMRVAVCEIEQFVIEETPFLASHYKKVLKDLETEGRLSVPYPPLGRKQGTFAVPSMTVIMT